MGQQQSKDELLYQQVNYGNVEGIRALFHDGASLEWIDREGKTPLIAACMNPELFNVAKTLIELGANVNGYRPGSHAGTPLHHAAKRGLEHTVNLLLSHGANALVMNDDCQTPLDVARAKGYSNVVRVIESHISFFSGWLRELYGPGFLEAFAPQWVSRKIWAVVIPGGTRNPSKPLKLELAVYPSPQDSQPRTIIALWKAKIEDPKFNLPDPTIIIFDKSSRTRYKFASANENDKQQLQWFYNACKGIPQAMHPPLPSTTHAPPLIPATVPPPSTEDVELAMAINASIQSAMVDRPPLPDTHLNTESTDTNDWGNNSADNATHNSWGPTGSAPPSNAGTSGWMVGPPKESYNGWGPGTSEAGPSNITPHTQTQDAITTAVSPSHSIPTISSSVPSAPPIPSDGIEIGPIHYPTIDMSPIDLSTPVAKEKPIGTGEVKEDEDASSSCVICLDAPIEGACIPCGHMAGCMSCLNGIKAKKWGCPVCRAKIDQVVRLYTV